MEGLVCTVNTSEFATELGCSTVADLRACTSGNREPILANDHLKDKHMVIVWHCWTVMKGLQNLWASGWFIGVW
jgi:hypothetical protein